MIEVEIFVKGAATLVSGAFAVVILASGPKRSAQRYLAAFLGLIALNQGADTMFSVVDGDAAAMETWARVAAVFAALDPLLLYYFASIYPERNALNRPVPVAVVAATSAFFALASAEMLPEGWGSPTSRWLVAGMSAYTGVVYTVIFVAFARRMLARPDEPAHRPLVYAMAFAAVPVWARLVVQLEGAIWATVHSPTTPMAVPFIVAMRAAMPVAAALAAVATWALATRTGGAPEGRRHVARALVAAFALTFILRFADVVAAFAVMGLTDHLPQTLGRIANSVRWLLFGGLVSVAILRHRLLAMTLLARRRAARALVGLSALTLAVAVLAIVAEFAGGRGVELRPIEIGLALLVLVASQGFRSLVDRVAWRVYGVPLPGDVVGRQEAYRRAAVQVAQSGGSLGDDSDLRRLREDLGLDEATAAALDRVAESVAVGPLAPGHVVAGRYRIERLLGRGASSRVFLARDSLLERPVVIKEMANERGAEAALREARIAGGLDSRHVATVHDVLQRQSSMLLICEHVAGGTLADRVGAEGPLPQRQGLALLRGVLEGLAAVHARGIVHRDLKPSNVLLTASGEPKIADFGIARLRTGDTTLAPGAFEGTPGFMPPEQRRGEPSTCATDVWAAGALARVAVQAPLPPAVEAVVARAMDDDPARRYFDARAMLAALLEALGPEEQQAAPHADHVAVPQRPALPPGEGREVEAGAVPAVGDVLDRVRSALPDDAAVLARHVRVEVERDGDAAPPSDDPLRAR